MDRSSRQADVWARVWGVNRPWVRRLPRTLPASLTLLAALTSLSCSTPLPAAPARAGESACTPGTETPERLVFAVAATGLPEDAARAYGPMAARLSADVGLPIEVRAFVDYASLSAAVASREADLAVLPPVAYVRTRAIAPCATLLRARVTEGTVHYSGYIVARKDSRFRDVASLAGARIAFVSAQSASGYVFSRAALEEAGLDPIRDFAQAKFLGSHEAVVRAVLQNEADAGATYFEGIQRARAAGAGTGDLRIIAITRAIPSDALVTRAGLSPTLVERLLHSLDGIHAADAEGRKALAGLPSVNGWVPVQDAFYDPVRELLRRPDAPLKEAP